MLSYLKSLKFWSKTFIKASLLVFWQKNYSNYIHINVRKYKYIHWSRLQILYQKWGGGAGLQLVICPERVEKLLPEVFFILEMYMLVRNVLGREETAIKGIFLILNIADGIWTYKSPSSSHVPHAHIRLQALCLFRQFCLRQRLIIYEVPTRVEPTDYRIALNSW